MATKSTPKSFGKPFQYKTRNPLKTPDGGAKKPPKKNNSDPK